MRADIVPGGLFPDYELPDHTGMTRTLSNLQGRDPMILTLPRGHYCPKAPAAPGTGRPLPEDRGSLHPGRHDLHRRPPHPAGVPRLGRRPVDLPVRPRADRAAGPRHCRIHRPGQQPDDPAYPGAQARAGRPPYLQRLLVLGPSLVLRPVARPARRHGRDPPGLGPERPRAARGVGRRRLVTLPRMGQQDASSDPDGLIPVTVPELVRLLRDIVTPATPARPGPPTALVSLAAPPSAPRPPSPLRPMPRQHHDYNELRLPYQFTGSSLWARPGASRAVPVPHRRGATGARTGCSGCTRTVQGTIHGTVRRLRARAADTGHGRYSRWRPGGRRVFAVLDDGWRLTADQRARLAPAVQAGLGAGWLPQALAAFTGANTAGVRNPYAVLAAPLSPAELPPQQRQRPARPPWCGECDEVTRMLGFDGDAPRPCPHCKPWAAARRDNGPLSLLRTARCLSAMNQPGGRWARPNWVAAPVIGDGIVDRPRVRKDVRDGLPTALVGALGVSVGRVRAVHAR